MLKDKWNHNTSFILLYVNMNDIDYDKQFCWDKIYFHAKARYLQLIIRNINLNQDIRYVGLLLSFVWEQTTNEC